MTAEKNALREAAAIGWDAAIAALKYEDGTSVEIVTTVNPYRVTSPAACCDLHNRNCEPPSELCCRACTEAAHPYHRDGSECIAPDLSGTRVTPPGVGA